MDAGKVGLRVTGQVIPTKEPNKEDTTDRTSKAQITTRTEGVSLADIHSIIKRASSPQLLDVIPFSKYLTKVFENPKLIRTSGQRIYDMIMEEGFETVLRDGETVYSFNFFTKTDEGKDAISGIEAPVHKLVGALKGTADFSGPHERIILLVGPVSSAKTTIVRIIKNGLEKDCRTDKGALFAIQWRLEDENGNPLFQDLPKFKKCDVHDDPFNLLSNKPGNNIRKEVIDKLNEKLRAETKASSQILPYELQASGDVCPACNDIVHRLHEYYAAKGLSQEEINEKLFEHVEAKRIYLDESRRVGLTTYEPGDEKSRSTDDLTGAINLRKLMKSGSDDDPQAFDFNGELSLSNRGIIHMDEILKLSTDLLKPLLTAAQDRKYKPTKLPQVSFDATILGTTNIPDWEKVKNNPFLQAIKSRIVPIMIPYNGKVSDEVKIYKKSALRSAEGKGIHIAPHGAWAASLWAVMTRLAPPMKGLTLLNKALLFDGERIGDITPMQLIEMKKDTPPEANELLKGVPPRMIQDAFSAAQNHPDVSHPEKGSHCISPFLILETLKNIVGSPESDITAAQRGEYEGLRKEVDLELKRRIVRDVHRAIAGNEKDLEALFARYKENVFAEDRQEKVINPFTKQKEKPDATLMKAIESKAGISDAERKGHREWFIKQFAYADDDSPFTYSSDQKLRRALEEYLIETHSDLSIKLPDLTGETSDKEAQKQIEVVKSRLYDKRFGYCEHCAPVALAIAASPKDKGTGK